MDSPKILLPFSFTSYDFKALDFVARTYAHRGDVKITLLFVYTPPPRIDRKGSPVLDRMAADLVHLERVVEDQRNSLEAARRALVEAGFRESAVACVFAARKKDIAGEIIDRAVQGDFDIVVLHNKPRRATRFFSGTVYSRVVPALRDKTVFVIT